MSRSSEIRKSREYRIAIARHKRKHPRCMICGAIRGRVVHHINSLSYFPELAMEPDNLVTLCDHRANNCHGSIHIDYKGSYRKKVTREDFDRWYKIVTLGRNTEPPDKY